MLVELNRRWANVGGAQMNPVSGDLDSYYNYDADGRLTEQLMPMVGPELAPLSGCTSMYEYGDAMGRLSALKQRTRSGNLVSGALAQVTNYTISGQIQSLSYFGQAESRGFNDRGQVTQMTAGPHFNTIYTYKLNQNDGKIETEVDATTGETVQHEYDELGRLKRAKSAVAGAWGIGYAFDGFGNLLQKNAVAGQVAVDNANWSVDPSKNQINSAGFTHTMPMEMRRW